MFWSISLTVFISTHFIFVVLCVFINYRILCASQCALFRKIGRRKIRITYSNHVSRFERGNHKLHQLYNVIWLHISMISSESNIISLFLFPSKFSLVWSLWGSQLQWHILGKLLENVNIILFVVVVCTPLRCMHFFFSKIVNHTNIGNLFIELVSFFAHSVCCFHQRLQFDFVFTASSTFNNNISCWRIEKWGNKEQWTLIWLRTVKPVNTDPRIQRKSCEWKKTRFHPPHSIESF